jgi:hypothetical protein
MALAEKVLERLAEDETKVTKAQLDKRTAKEKKASRKKKRGGSDTSTFRGRVRTRVKKSKKPDGIITAISKEKVAQDDEEVKKAQGNNTPRSVFGGNSNQTSTTAGGGTLGQELAKTKPESQHSMNRRGSSTVDNEKVAANLADAKSGRNAANLEKEIDADTKKNKAAKIADY